MAHLLSGMFSCRTEARTSAVHTVSWVVTGETIDTNDNIYYIYSVFIIPMRLFLIIKDISNGQSALQCSLNAPYFTINVLCSYARKVFLFSNMDACLLASPNNA